MTTIILPEAPLTPGLKNTANTGKIEHDQTDKNECTANVENTSHYTAFEQLLLKHNDVTHLNQQ